MRRDPTEGVGMSAMAQAQFDIEALKRAFEAREAGKVLEFYSSDLEHIEIDAGAPPNSPRKSGTEYIGNAIEGAAQAGITLHMENPACAAPSIALPMNSVPDLRGEFGGAPASISMCS